MRLYNAASCVPLLAPRRYKAPHNFLPYASSTDSSTESVRDPSPLSTNHVLPLEPPSHKTCQDDVEHRQDENDDRPVTTPTPTEDTTQQRQPVDANSEVSSLQSSLSSNATFSTLSDDSRDDEDENGHSVNLVYETAEGGQEIPYVVVRRRSQDNNTTRSKGNGRHTQKSRSGRAVPSSLCESLFLPGGPLSKEGIQVTIPSPVKTMTTKQRRARSLSDSMILAAVASANDEQDDPITKEDLSQPNAAIPTSQETTPKEDWAVFPPENNTNDNSHVDVAPPTTATHCNNAVSIPTRSPNVSRRRRSSIPDFKTKRRTTGPCTIWDPSPSLATRTTAASSCTPGDSSNTIKNNKINEANSIVDKGLQHEAVTIKMANYKRIHASNQWMSEVEADNPFLVAHAIDTLDSTVPVTAAQLETLELPQRDEYWIMAETDTTDGISCGYQLRHLLVSMDQVQHKVDGLLFLKKLPSFYRSFETESRKVRTACREVIHSEALKDLIASIQDVCDASLLRPCSGHRNHKSGGYKKTLRISSLWKLRDSPVLSELQNNGQASSKLLTQQLGTVIQIDWAGWKDLQKQLIHWRDVSLPYVVATALDPWTDSLGPAWSERQQDDLLRTCSSTASIRSARQDVRALLDVWNETIESMRAVAAFLDQGQALDPVETLVELADFLCLCLRVV